MSHVCLSAKPLLGFHITYKLHSHGTQDESPDGQTHLNQYREWGCMCAVLCLHSTAWWAIPSLPNILHADVPFKIRKQYHYSRFYVNLAQVLFVVFIFLLCRFRGCCSSWSSLHWLSSKTLVPCLWSGNLEATNSQPSRTQGFRDTMQQGFVCCESKWRFIGWVVVSMIFLFRSFPNEKVTPIWQLVSK